MGEDKDNVIKFNIDKKKTGEKFFSRFPCIELVKDVNGNLFNPDLIEEYSRKVCYIVTIMRKTRPSTALYKYKVAQKSLLRFLEEVKNSDGFLVEIEKYIPDDLA